jgi:CBS domain-containing protein
MEAVMLCSEIMQKPVKWISAEDTALTAARVMRAENIGFLPVCDRSGRVVGTVTDRDLAVRIVAENVPAETRLVDVMTKTAIQCRPTDDILAAEQLMGTHRKSRIVCTDGEGHLLGIVSIADIAKHDDGWRVARTVRKVTSREVR